MSKRKTKQLLDHRGSVKREVVVDKQGKYKPLNPREIEKIFADKKNNSDKKPEWYCESSELSLNDQKWIWDNIPAKPQVFQQIPKKKDDKVKVSKVKGIKVSMVTAVAYDGKRDKALTKKKSSKEEVSFKLAEVLDDLENLPWYEKLVNERRCDFLKNCLVITLSAYKRRVITTTKAKYFTGVVKQRTAGLERIKRYKRRHTT